MKSTYRKRIETMFEHFRDKMQMHRDRHAWEGGGRFGFGRGGPGGLFGRGSEGRDGEGHGGRGRGGRFFEHGALRLVILAMMAEKPYHGYELIKEIEDKVGGSYTPSAGVVYPTLTLLEETGLIEVAASEGNKKLYAITDAGRQTIEANRPQIDAMFARMSEAGRRHGGSRDPRILRAIENLKLALRLKLGTELDDTRTAALAALLDETVTRIEKL
jgi:DNA-binding PadR family transcriptional regulator